MMRKLASLSLIAMTAGHSASAFAHTGHGATSSQSLLHYLAEPVHLAAVLAALGVATVAIVRHRSQRAEAVRVEK